MIAGSLILKLFFKSLLLLVRVSVRYADLRLLLSTQVRGLGTIMIKMAAAFGVWEVRFPSSRAVYDEDDEEDEEISTSEDDSNNLNFHWAPHLKRDQNSSPTECPLMVLAIGEVATTFVEAHYLSAGSEIVACLTSKKGNEVEFEKLCNKFKSDDTCCLHRLKTNHDDSVFLQCGTPVPQEKAFHWTEKVRMGEQFY